MLETTQRMMRAIGDALKGGGTIHSRVADEFSMRRDDGGYSEVGLFGAVALAYESEVSELLATAGKCPAKAATTADNPWKEAPRW